ncbi:Trypsin-like serine protease [Glarea lozoyensis ATCC 20868]|uniref:Trypsin-like serine protease n=1 Tax=Glarea lozoyensis (strain ATCC 20868 / MF5171) TaxID=1116229 RepID=S3D2F0_GLAL2|nr:Trypsin-like serine protease [Glarea lozoyensis ATCC 20868]EPE31304.1 Trypsin-like serine protease [Glarea lozoyensis ATCC 20868]
MSSSKRTLRSSKPPDPAPKTQPPVQTTSPAPITFTVPLSLPTTPIKIHPPNTLLPSLNTKSLKLLRLKQKTLRATSSSILKTLPESSPTILTALNSTLIFAQHEAGTAVLIHKDGWVLTCSHCFGDTLEEYEEDSKVRWLLFHDGKAVLAECKVWDGVRDLALLKIVAVECETPPLGKVPQFSCLEVRENKIKVEEAVYCIGQPGAEDLESSTARKTKYNLFEVSSGSYRGLAKGSNPQDNSEIGSLMHDAWTYWGHSGAPIVDLDGKLVGLHSSWDDETGMRRGIPGVAVVQLLKENRGLMGLEEEGVGSRDDPVVV